MVINMDFEEQVLDAKSEEELKKVKLFLFQEQVKIQAKKDELLELGHELLEEKKALERERHLLNLKIEAQQKRFQENELFMAKKQHILENAYQQLNVDKKVLECERLNFEYEKRMFTKQRQASAIERNHDVCFESATFFVGVDNQLALRKCYKDLLKIYHPDNRCGDTRTLQKIQAEYDALKRQYYDV